jgi:enoyl-CoA hydratase
MTDVQTNYPGTVELTEIDEIATITIDRQRKLNALTPEVLDELERVVRDCATSDSRVVVLRTAGERAFCVGADITRFAGLDAVRMWRDWTARGHRVFDAIAALPQPTIAVLQGDAFGGGLELALAADFRIVADHARLGLPETGLGTVPGWGGTERLTKLIGTSRTKLVCLARRTFTAGEALATGLATATAPAAELDKVTQALVDELSAGAPIAVRLAKQLIDAAADGAPARVLEPLAGALTATTADLAEGIAAFRDRRTSHFSGS